MSTLLIAVKSCDEYRLTGHNDAIRRTWGSTLIPPFDDVVQQRLLFFQGRTDAVLQPDEVSLNVADGYNNLGSKCIDIYRYFMHQNYDFLFVCDTDTFCRPKHFRRCTYDEYDVAGYFTPNTDFGTSFPHTDNAGNKIEQCYPYPSGGIGYFLSRPAAAVLIKTKPLSWAEDLNVGLVLGPCIKRQELSASNLPYFFQDASWHFVPEHYRSKYDPAFKWQEYMYKTKGC